MGNYKELLEELDNTFKVKREEFVKKLDEYEGSEDYEHIREIQDYLQEFRDIEESKKLLYKIHKLD
jgi:hypothetical protein